jgi:hypothetical protein
MQLLDFESFLNVTMVCGFWLFTVAMVINYLKAFAK